VLADLALHRPDGLDYCVLAFLHVLLVQQWIQKCSSKNIQTLIVIEMKNITGKPIKTCFISSRGSGSTKKKSSSNALLASIRLDGSNVNSCSRRLSALAS
jgi:hypothetical protein